MKFVVALKKAQQRETNTHDKGWKNSGSQ